MHSVEDVANGWVRKLYDEAVPSIRHRIRSYWLNHAYLQGQQWLWWDHIQHRVNADIPDDVDRIQATVNHMRANVRVLIGTLTQQELHFEVKPSSYDDATLRSTRLAEAILEELRLAHNWETRREEVLHAVLKGGTAAVAVDWNTADQTSVERVLSISEFVVEPGTRDAERARWWIKTQVLPPGEVQAMFNLSERPPSDASHGMAPWQRQYTGDNAGIPLTLVLTYYERPSPLCPEGRFYVEVDGKILQKGVWPFPWKHKLNLRVCRETIIENEWAGTTFLDDVRPVQTILNAAWSNAVEHLKLAANARLVVDEATDEERLTDMPGEFFRVAQGHREPRWLAPPAMPNITSEAIMALKMEIDNISGVHDVSRGQAPANIESGYGLSILAEKDASPIGRLIKETARLWQEVAQMVLMLHQQEVTKKRTLVIHTTNGPSREEWKGADIDDQIDVRVPLDAIIPKSRAAQAAWAQNALQMGLIQGVAQYARLADMPGQDDIIATVLPDVARAMRENHQMAMLSKPIKDAEIPLPAVYDDHALHIETHNEFRKSVRYEQMDSERREIVDDHIQAHETMMAQQLANRRQGEALDPALGQMPRADGAPPLDPAALVAPLPLDDGAGLDTAEEMMAEAAPQPQQDIVDPNTVVSDMIAALEAGEM